VKKSNKKSFGFFTMTFFVIFFTTLAFINVWFRTEVVKFEYELEQVISRKLVVEKEREYLEAQYERLCSAKRVEKVAVKKLKMKIANREEIVFIPYKSPIALASFKK
jgi:cell division protein FtsL